MTANAARLVKHGRVVEGIWADERMPHRVRDLALALAWTLHVERNTKYARVAELLHAKVDHVWMALREDVPRFTSLPAEKCVGSMKRGGCGRRPSRWFRVTDPETGMWCTDGWCSRHKDQADAALVRERALDYATLPVPVPNAGGLLPCHFKADWTSSYQWASPGWTGEPWGQCADNWPTTTPPAPVLAWSNPDLTERPTGPPPHLTLVTT